MFDAINGMLLDRLAAVARKGYEDRRQKEGQVKAKLEGVYKGGRKIPSGTRHRGHAEVRPELVNVPRCDGCSRATAAKIAKRIAAA